MAHIDQGALWPSSLRLPGAALKFQSTLNNRVDPKRKSVRALCFTFWRSTSVVRDIRISHSGSMAQKTGVYQNLFL